MAKVRLIGQRAVAGCAARALRSACSRSRADWTATLSCLAKNAGVTDASLIGTAGHLTIQRSRPQKWQTYSGVDRSRDLGAAPLNWNSAMELLESHFIVDYFVDFLETRSEFDRLCIH
ncbi:unnamed protein product [Durusdinium trenchii]|uniref:Uncharacterized protein n=1 Tax=Durusdinium trenchii TaxID=1381693 RepID=A0ABP0QJH8_9DINO